MNNNQMKMAQNLLRARYLGEFSALESKLITMEAPAILEEASRYVFYNEIVGWVSYQPSAEHVAILHCLGITLAGLCMHYNGNHLHVEEIMEDICSMVDYNSPSHVRIYAVNHQTDPCGVTEDCIAASISNSESAMPEVDGSYYCMVYEGTLPSSDLFDLMILADMVRNPNSPVLFLAHGCVVEVVQSALLPVGFYFYDEVDEFKPVHFGAAEAYDLRNPIAVLVLVEGADKPYHVYLNPDNDDIFSMFPTEVQFIRPFVDEPSIWLVAPKFAIRYSITDPAQNNIESLGMKKFCLLGTMTDAGFSGLSDEQFERISKRLRRDAEWEKITNFLKATVGFN